MPPSLLPQMYAAASLSRVAYSALPDAPVQPHVNRRVSPGRVYAALRERFTAAPAPVTRIDNFPSADDTQTGEARRRVA